MIIPVNSFLSCFEGRKVFDDGWERKITRGFQREEAKLYRIKRAKIVAREFPIRDGQIVTCADSHDLRTLERIAEDV